MSDSLMTMSSREEPDSGSNSELQDKELEQRQQQEYQRLQPVSQCGCRFDCSNNAAAFTMMQPPRLPRLPDRKLHITTRQVASAIAQLGERKGSSLSRIQNVLCSERRAQGFKCPSTDCVQKALVRGVRKGEFSVIAKGDSVARFVLCMAPEHNSDKLSLPHGKKDEDVKPESRRSNRKKSNPKVPEKPLETANIADEMALVTTPKPATAKSEDKSANKRAKKNTEKKPKSTPKVVKPAKEKKPKSTPKADKPAKTATTRKGGKQRRTKQ